MVPVIVCGQKLAQRLLFYMSAITANSAVSSRNRVTTFSIISPNGFLRSALQLWGNILYKRSIWHDKKISRRLFLRSRSIFSRSFWTRYCYTVLRIVYTSSQLSSRIRGSLCCNRTKYKPSRLPAWPEVRNLLR